MRELFKKDNSEIVDLEPVSRAWTSSRVFDDATEYFSAVIDEIGKAEVSIDFESYIFDLDHVGRPIVKSLILAAHRGVKVRVLVDGYGTINWFTSLKPLFECTGVEFRPYHALPFPLSRLSYNEDSSFLHQIERFKIINRRNHKKLIIIDQKVVFTGSYNITEKHLEWQDVGVRLEGPAVDLMVESFKYSWARARVIKIPKIKVYKLQKHPLVLLNHGRNLRRKKTKYLLQKMKTAKRRLYLMNAYFVPTPNILAQLTAAAQRGVDVRIVVPRISDVRMIKWIGRLFYAGLMRMGVKIYEYQPKFLHAKTLLIDDWALIGSSNLNHRSILHDLEIDVAFRKDEVVKKMDSIMTRVLSESELVTLESTKTWNWFDVFIARVLTMFQHWF